MIVPGGRELVWVTGPDAVAFLDGLLSQSIAPMESGTVRRALLLSPQGKLRAPLWVLRGDDRVGLVVEAGFTDRVVDDLSRFRIRVDAAIGEHGSHLTEIWGDRSLVAEGTWTEEDGLRADLPLVIGSMPRAVVVGEAAGPLLSEAVRIEQGEPRLGVDIDESTIVQEAFLVDGAVDFTKGCYLGQELVARIDSRGHVNKYLRGLVAPAPLDAGAALTLDDVEVGAVTSSAVSETLGPIALAMVRREAEPGSVVFAQETPAEVRELPLL